MPLAASPRVPGQSSWPLPSSVFLLACPSRSGGRRAVSCTRARRSGWPSMRRPRRRPGPSRSGCLGADGADYVGGAACEQACRQLRASRFPRPRLGRLLGASGAPWRARDRLTPARILRTPSSFFSSVQRSRGSIPAGAGSMPLPWTISINPSGSSPRLRGQSPSDTMIDTSRGASARARGRPPPVVRDHPDHPVYSPRVRGWGGGTRGCQPVRAWAVYPPGAAFSWPGGSARSVRAT